MWWQLLLLYAKGRAEKISNKQNVLTRKWLATINPQWNTSVSNCSHLINTLLSLLPQQHRWLKARRHHDLFYSLAAHWRPDHLAHHFSFLHHWCLREHPDWKHAVQQTAHPLVLQAEQGKDDKWKNYNMLQSYVSICIIYYQWNVYFLTLPPKSWKINSTTVNH